MCRMSVVENNILAIHVSFKAIIRVTGTYMGLPLKKTAFWPFPIAKSPIYGTAVEEKRILAVSYNGRPLYGGRQSRGLYYKTFFRIFQQIFLIF